MARPLDSGMESIPPPAPFGEAGRHAEIADLK